MDNIFVKMIFFVYVDVGPGGTRGGFNVVQTGEMPGISDW